MVDPALATRRLVAQGLVEAQHGSVKEIVEAFGAMQGQDLAGVIASVALRLPVPDVAAVLAALNDGDIVRGYPMRGTVFLMAAEDVTWVTQLCAAAPLRAAIGRRSDRGLDDAMVERARDLLATSLAAAPTGLPRSAISELWEDAGLPTSGGGTYHLLSLFMHEAIICWGPWNGTDQNVVLSDAWLPAGRTLEERFNGDVVEATAELLRRYLLSHGPATVRDFAWWTKLPLGQIRKALPLVEDAVESDGERERFWRPGLPGQVEALGKLVGQPLLLPGYDEFILGYPCRQFAMTADQERLLVPGNNGVFKKCAVADGLAKGFWTRDGRIGKRKLRVEAWGKTLVRHHKGWERRFQDYPFVSP